MSKFIQVHALTNYPPSNLNRDDLGRPKTAIVGGSQRLRISSQSLKRAWRTSPLFEEGILLAKGERTRRLGKELLPYVLELGVNKDQAIKLLKQALEPFGKLCEPAKKEIDPHKEICHPQLIHYSPEEINAIKAYLKESATKSESKNEPKDLVGVSSKAVDIAMFGRMLARCPNENIEAAVQVAHAFTVNEAAVESDYFIGVDDLTEKAQETGAGMVKDTEFGSGLFYLYVCIDTDLLKKNLQDDEQRSAVALQNLMRSIATISPSGKQNSFASRAYALYMSVEKGSQQPRSLASAFLKPIGREEKSGDMISDAVAKLQQLREHFNTVYGRCYEDISEFNVWPEPVGTLETVLKFAT